MKKNLLFIGLMLALSLTASAQNDGFAFGFKVGPNMGWTGSTTDAAIREGSRVGFDLGVIAEFYFAENYAISTGVNVGLMGGHYSFDKGQMVTDSLGSHINPCFVDRVYKSTLYEIPIMLKMVTNELGNTPVRVYAQVGAGLGLVPQKVRVKDAINGNATSDKWEITNKEYSLFRTSLKIAAGAQYSLDESTRLFAGFYFSHDFLNNINHISPNYAGNYYDENGENIGDRDTKLNVLQNRLGFEVGVLF